MTCAVAIMRGDCGLPRRASSAVSIRQPASSSLALVSSAMCQKGASSQASWISSHSTSVEAAA
jgi:hypothetical protein